MVLAAVTAGSAMVAVACAEVARRAVLGRHLEHVLVRVRDVDEEPFRPTP